LVEGVKMSDSTMIQLANASEMRVESGPCNASNDWLDTSTYSTQSATKTQKAELRFR